MKLAFLGLGRMGGAMAANLAKGNYALKVWNRDPAKLAGLTALGAHAADSPRSAALDCDLVITMLADDAAVEAVVEGEHGIAQGMREDALHVSMSTISTAAAERLTRFHRSRGQRFLSAPVFGRPEAAAAAKLFILSGGAAADHAIAVPVFNLLGQRVFIISEEPAAANLVKLCGNFMILAAIESMGEAMALAQKGGVDRHRLLEVLTGTLFDLPLYKNYGGMLARRQFAPAGFAAALGLKDMRLAAHSAEQLQVPMPVLNVLRDHLLQTIASEAQEVDWSGIGLAIDSNAAIKRSS